MANLPPDELVAGWWKAWSDQSDGSALGLRIEDYIASKAIAWHLSQLFTKEVREALADAESSSRESANFARTEEYKRHCLKTAATIRNLLAQVEEGK